MMRMAQRTGACVLLALALGATVVGTAAGKPILVGSPIEGEFKGAVVRSAGTFFNSALSDPNANVVSPVDGAVIRFKVQGAEGIPYSLRVLSPEGGSVYRATGSTPPRTFAEFDKGFRPLKINKGDTIGIDLPVEAVIGVAAAGPESAYAVWIPPLPHGAALPYTATKTERELAFNAEVLPAPQVRKVSPRSIELGKRTKVKIHGTDLTQISKVKFGRLRVGFRRVSERLVIATLPALKRPLRTRVRVTTVAGTNALTPGSLFVARD